jgi:hypothetical protein
MVVVLLPMREHNLYHPVIEFHKEVNQRQPLPLDTVGEILIILYLLELITQEEEVEGQEVMVQIVVEVKEVGPPVMVV